MPTQPAADDRPRPATASRLTLDLGLQREGEKALLQGIENARAGGKPATRARSSRSTRATGRCSRSAPIRLRPEQVRQAADRRRIRSARGQPSGGRRTPSRLINRAVNGGLPDGLDVQADHRDGRAGSRASSTRARRSARVSASKRPVAAAEQFCNAGKADYGAVGLVEALKVSSDTYFFEAGELANSHGNVIQNKAHKLGVGEQTGIDLPSELTGTGARPRVAWRTEQAQGAECERRTPRVHPAASAERAAVERGRQHAPGRRAGRPADRPAADGGGLLDACQRLHATAAKAPS